MAAQDQSHIDKIVVVMGEFKAFTLWQVLVLSLIPFPTAFQLLANVFTTKNVPHRCAPPEDNDTSLILSQLDRDPRLPSTYLTISYEQCQILVSENDTVLQSFDCMFGMRYDLPRDVSAVSQFDLVCDYASLAKLSQTLVIAGQGAGALIFTVLSDRLGRRPVLVMSNLGLLVDGLAIAYAPNYTAFAIFKFIVGALQQGCLITYATLLLELVTTRYRHFQAFWGGVMWGIAAMSMAFVAFLLRQHSWRTLQMAFSLSSLSFLLQWRFTKESFRWLIANGQRRAITSYIRQVTSVNKTNAERVMEVYSEASHLEDETSECNEKHSDRNLPPNRAKLNLFDLLKVKRLLLSSIVLWLAWFTTSLSFFAIYLNSTSLAGNPYLNFFFTALMEVPNNFVLYYCLQKIGRRRTLILFFVVISVGLIGCGIFKSLEQTSAHINLALVFSCLAMSGASPAFAILFIYTPEIFPTNMRNQAVGWSSLVGRAGGMIAPFISVLALKAQWAPGVLIGCLAFLVCMTSILLPETKGRELPQTIGDILAWYNKKPDDKSAEAINQLADE